MRARSTCWAFAVAATGACLALAGDADRRPFTYHWCVGGPFASRVDISATPIRSDAVMFYEHTFGVIPRFYNKQVERGGVPQQADLTAHLAKVRLDVLAAIPDPDWDGYAIIDLEAWDPIWDHTAQEYRDLSIRLSRQSHPTRSDRDIERLARASYEAAARTFLERTLSECKALRPRAKWGYYGWPWTYHEPVADKLKWLIDASTALYPVCYMVFKSAPGGQRIDGLAPPEEYENQTRRQVAFSRRLAGPNKPVIAVIWARYHDMNKAFGLQFVDSADLDRMLRIPREAGADGVAFWDAVQSEEDARQCNDFIRQRLAPMLRAGWSRPTESRSR